MRITGAPEVNTQNMILPVPDSTPGGPPLLHLADALLAK